MKPFVRRAWSASKRLLRRAWSGGWRRLRRCLGIARHPVQAIKSWRWRRAERRRVAGLGGFRMPLQVCPQGCGFRELARREVVARTRLMGRVVLHVEFEYDTTNCPDCGALLARRCTRCRGPILAPLSERCEYCGLPYPWSTIRASQPRVLEGRGWRRGDEGVHVPALPLYCSTGGTIWVVEGDIVELAVNAIISNDDVDGRMWTEVARAIKVAAGDEVERQAGIDAPFEQGHAWLTRAGALTWLDAVIHVAAMDRLGKSSATHVEACICNALNLAREHEFESVGIAVIGSGPFAIPTDEWYRRFARVATEHVTVAPDEPGDENDEPGDENDEPGPGLDIVLVLFEADRLQAEGKILRRAIREGWRQLGKPEYGHPIEDPERSRLTRLLPFGPRARATAEEHKSEPFAKATPAENGDNDRGNDRQESTSA